MFSFFHKDVLIGRSELEKADPPMGVAYGQLELTHAFVPLRKIMKPSRDGSGKKQRDMRYLEGISAKTADGVALVCVGVEVVEYGEANNPFGWEVFCLGVSQPPYRDLFPHHVRAYEEAFKKPNEK